MVLASSFRHDGFDICTISVSIFCGIYQRDTLYPTVLPCGIVTYRLVSMVAALPRVRTPIRIDIAQGVTTTKEDTFLLHYVTVTRVALPPVRTT